nr:hypothetical protein [Tanacetum cinerariifolium]
METTIKQQVVMDEALVPSTQRLRIERRNLRFPSDIQSKESTLQLVYDVLRRCPFFKAFLVTADMLEIYMQDFWATAYVHQQSIRFKINNKKLILSLESFWKMLYICPRIHGQSFDELPFEEEILDFIRFLRHSATIRTLTDININKLYQPWRSFAAIINKCLTGKSSGYDNFVYQVEHKNHKKSNEMYYPRFIKVVIHHFMSKDLSIPRRNKINWHYVRDDSIFSTIKVVSRDQNTQQYGAMLPIELMNDETRNTKAYKEYYAFANGEAAPKPKASARRKKSCSDTSITTPTATTTPKPTVAVTPRLTAAAKGKQTAKSLSAPLEPGGSSTDEGTGSKPGVPDIPTDESEEELSWNSFDDEGANDQEKLSDDDEGDEDDTERSGDDTKEGESDADDNDEETRDEENFDPIPRTPESSEDEGDGEEDQCLNVNEEEHVEEEEEDELYRDVNINQGRGLQATQEVKDTHVTLTPINSDGQQKSSSVSSQFVTNMLNPTSDVGMESIFATASSSVAPLHTSTPIMTPSTIATITTISQAPIPPTPISSEVLQNLPTFASVFRFDDILKSLEANFSEYRQTNSFAEVVSAILGIVYQYMNQQMTEAVRVAVQIQTDRLPEVLTRSSHSSRTSYVVAADLSEMELKKILIEKMEGNKRRDDDDDQDEGPSAGSDRGSKRWREGKEPESASASLETATRSAGKSTKPKQPSTPDRVWNKTLLAVQGSTQIWISELAKQANSRSSFNELLDTPLDFSNFIMNWMRVDTLTFELLAGPSFEMMKGSCTSLIELEYHLEEVYKATTDQLDWVNPEGQQYPHNLLQPLPLIPDNRGRRVISFYTLHQQRPRVSSGRCLKPQIYYISNENKGRRLRANQVD